MPGARIDHDEGPQRRIGRQVAVTGQDAQQGEMQGFSRVRP
jgi:hypothetical protein